MSEFNLDFLDGLGKKKTILVYIPAFKAYKPANRFSRRFLFSEKIKNLILKKGLKFSYNSEIKDITIIKGENK